jgi:hypothetical protein
MGKMTASILEMSSSLWTGIFGLFTPDELNKSIDYLLAMLTTWAKSQIDDHKNDPNLRSKYTWLRNYLSWVSSSEKSHFIALLEAI